MPSVIVMPLILSPLIYLSGRWLAATARGIALVAMGIVWLFFFLAIRDFTHDNTNMLIYRMGMIAFYFDGISLLLTAIVLFLGMLVILYSGPGIRGMQGEEKYYAMLLLMTGAVIGLVSAGDLFNLWLWFEMTAISSYVLVAFCRDRKDSLAACAKFLIQTAAGSILVLFGMALVFAETGTLDLAYADVHAGPLMFVAGALFIIGFGVKIALVPTYTWLPDAYAQAPTGISAMLSGIVTISGLVALLRTLAMVSGLATPWGAVLIGFGTGNMIAGNLLALRQTHVKRIFAYSSISHIGFILLAIGIGLLARQYSGFYSGMLHLLNHALMKALAFLTVGTVIYTRLNKSPAIYVSDLKGLAGRDSIAAFALVVACLSLAGIPPLAGFMSKFQIFTAGLETENPALALLVIFAAFNSVLSLAYCFPMMNALFQPASRPRHRTAPAAMHVPLVLLTALVIVLGVAPTLVDGLITPASHSLMRLFGG